MAKRSKFKVQGKYGKDGKEKWKEVNGYVDGPLGIHKEGQRWSVTHLASGLGIHILRSTSLKQARWRVAEALKLPLDWSQPDEGICKQPTDLIDRQMLGRCVMEIAGGKTAIEAMHMHAHPELKEIG